MTLVSVVIPSYQHAAYVEAALRSVLDQDYESLELIVVDDGSTDDSDAVIRRTLAAYPGRRTAYHPQPNEGAHAAIMRGLSLASGEVLTILNSDDHYEPGRLSRMLGCVPRGGSFIAFSKLRMIDASGLTLAPDAPLQRWYDGALRDSARCPTVGFALLRNNISVTSGNLVFSRNLYETVGGFRPYRMCHDWDFLMRATHCVEPTYVQRALMAYRYHENNTLRTTQHLREEEGVAALNAYVALGLGGPSGNPLAPSWANWPRYFDMFVDRFASWFSTIPMGAFLRERPAPDALGGGTEGWTDTARLGLEPCDFLTGDDSARDAYALLREVLLGGAGR